MADYTISYPVQFFRKPCSFQANWKTGSKRFRIVRGQLKCDGTRAETRFRLSAKRTSPFKSAGAPVQSTTGSRGVRISGSIAGYTMFRGSVKGTDYPLHSPVSPSIPLPCVAVCHHISTSVYSMRKLPNTLHFCLLSPQRPQAFLFWLFFPYRCSSHPFVLLWRAGKHNKLVKFIGHPPRQRLLGNKKQRHH
jgi:hypothetical protein